MTNIPTPNTRRVVSVAKAAAHAGVSRWTVHQWITAGLLPYIAYPRGDGEDMRGLKVDLNDLDAFIERRKDRRK